MPSIRRLSCTAYQLEDDTEDETVGTKDGEVAAQVWLEKDYKANAAQLSSNQYILFIGQDKLIKEKAPI